jgi:hypothetical protein
MLNLPINSQFAALEIGLHSQVSLFGNYVQHLDMPEGYAEKDAVACTTSLQAQYISSSTIYAL